MIGKYFSSRELNIGSEEKLKNDLGKMILLDYIIANTDRYYTNFSFLRNSNTLEWLGLVPIFDTEISMFNKISTEELKSAYFTDSKNIKAKPFYTKQLKQLEKFSSIIALQNINFSSLENIPDYYSELLSVNKRISKKRRDILVFQLGRRIEHAQSVVYRKNDIIKEFLGAIFKDDSSKNNLEKISSAFAQVSSKDDNYKRILNNYLRGLKLAYEKDMEKLILKDMDYFFKNNKGIEIKTRV